MSRQIETVLSNLVTFRFEQLISPKPFSRNFCPSVSLYLYFKKVHNAKPAAIVNAVSVQSFNFTYIVRQNGQIEKCMSLILLGLIVLISVRYGCSLYLAIYKINVQFKKLILESTSPSFPMPNLFHRFLFTFSFSNIF